MDIDLCCSCGAHIHIRNVQPKEQFDADQRVEKWLKRHEACKRTPDTLLKALSVEKFNDRR